MTSRAAVIGAGLAGLTAANVLVDRGLPVVVFERSARPGGRAETTEHGPYRFNQGPHALYVDAEGRQVLNRLGIQVAGHPPLTAGGLALYDQKLEKFPTGPGSLTTTRLLGTRAKVRIAALLARLPKMTGEREASMTVNQWVSSVTSDEVSADLVRAIVRLSTYANAPDQLDAGAAIAQLNRAVTGGVLYLDRGWGQLVESLRSRLEAKGGTIRHETVGSAQDLLDDFDVAVVGVGDPATVDALVGSGATAAIAGPPVEAAVLELGVAKVPEIRFILGIDEALYASVHSPPADLAPPGHSVVCLARYLSPAQQHQPDTVRDELMALAARMGIAETDIAESRYLHRLTVTHGLPLAEQGGLMGRPGVEIAGQPRLAIAGDWVGGRGLLADAAIASGHDAALRVAAALRVGAGVS